MKWTRQRCQVAVKILLTAALMPSWASEITSLTPRRPRRASLRRKAVQNVSASEGPISMPRTSPSIGIDANRDALDRPVEEGFYPLVDLFAQPADLALGDPTHAHGLDQIVDRASRDALDVG